MSSGDLPARVDALERRMAWVEAGLADLASRLEGRGEEPAATPTAVKKPEPAAPVEIMAPVVTGPAPDASSATAPASAETAPDHGTPEQQSVSEAAPHNAAPIETVRRTPPPLPRIRDSIQPRVRQTTSFERMIGERWAMVLGAIVVTIGVALFFKWAYDQGWFASIAPWLRCVLGGMFGAGLLVAGEILRKRITPLAGAGASAAGVGVMYTSAFAAYGLYELVTPSVAFALLAMCVAIGVVVSARGRLASVAVVSLVGGYLTPLLLARSGAPAWFLPSYLVALLLVGLLLAWRYQGRFRAVRTTVWWGTSILGGLWSLAEGVDAPATATAFYAVVWGLVHAELILSAARYAAATGDAEDWRRAWRRSRHLITSFATTVWAVGLGAAVMHAAWDGAWLATVLGCIGALAAIAASFGGVSSERLIDLVRSSPTTRAGELRVGLAVQAGVLAIAAVALAQMGWFEVFAWAALGVGGVVAAVRLRADALALYGLVVLLALLGKELVIDSMLTGAGTLVLGFWLTRWTLEMAVVGAGLVICGVLTRRGLGSEAMKPVWRVCGAWSVAVGLAAAATGLMHIDSVDVAMIGAGLVLAFALSGAAVLMRSTSVRAFGAVVLTGALAFLPGTFWWSASGVQAAGIVFTGDMALMLAAAATCFAIAWLWRQWKARTPVLVLTCAGLAVLMLSFGHEDAFGGAVMVVWMLIAMGVMGLSWLIRLWLDRVALGVLGATAALWLAVYPAQGWSSFDAPGLAHPGLVVLFFLTCAFAAALHRVARVGGAKAVQIVQVTIGVLAGLVLLATSLEVARVAEMATSDPRARRAAMSMWWGLYAIGLIAAGFWRRVGVARYAGLALIGTAVLKALVFDLVGVSPGWRVLSVIGLGLLLLVVAAGYAKLSSRLAPRGVNGGR